MPLANIRVRKNSIASVAALLGALIALAVVPAFASALIKVENAEDLAGAARCEPGAATGECTLRGAIEALDAGAGGPIEFSIGTFEGHVGTDEIQLLSPLPPIEESTTLFGHPVVGGPFTSPTVAVVAPAGEAALTIEASNVTVEDVAFGGGETGIEVIPGEVGFEAKGDWFGLKLDASANPIGGVALSVGPGDDAATIGGTAESERNVFAHADTGIELQGASLAKVLGNYIGVGPQGSGAASLETAVRIVDSTSFEARFDEIGSALTGPQLATEECVAGCNVIATDNGQAVDLAGDVAEPEPAATGPTQISGNYIGLGADGETLAGENTYGVLAAPSTPGCVAGPGGVTVGGPGAGEANYIEGGSEAIFAEAAEGFSAVGNVIGLTPDGSQSAGPEGVGIGLCDSGATGVAAQVTGNRMSLDADALGIEVVDGHAQITGNSVQGSNTGIVTREAGRGTGNVIAGNTDHQTRRLRDPPRRQRQHRHR